VTYEVSKYGIHLKSVDLGGTGFEVVTWVGDLGGGTGRLSNLRGAGFVPPPTDPPLIESAVFARRPPNNSDYGGYINLEGDVGAAVVASGGTTQLGAPVFAQGQRLSDAMRDYVTPAVWDLRATTFLKMCGGTFDPSAGTLTNRASLVSSFAQRIAAFSCNYLASRVNDQRLTLAAGEAGAYHVVGAANEVAGVFVDALVAAQTQGVAVSAQSPGVTYPSVSPRASTQSCSDQIGAAGWGRWLP
jgi:hypothetical protein